MQSERSISGFVLPVILGILLLVALFAVQAATELGSTTLFAGQRLMHQRAFESSESGIATVMEQLQANAIPAPRQQLQWADFPADTATVSTTARTRDLPPGFSAGRVVEKDYEIRSTGRSARGAEVTVVQGARQWQALSAP
jgi:Tfp pilus assembly protein PilX